MTTALNVSLTSSSPPPPLPAESESIINESDANLTDADQKTADVASSVSVKSDNSAGIGRFALYQTDNGSGTESDVIDDSGLVSSTPPPPGVVDDFLPSCDDVIQHLLQFAEDERSNVGTTVSMSEKPLPPAAKPEAEVSKTTVVSTSAATTPLSLQPTAQDSQAPPTPGEGMQQSRPAESAAHAAALPIAGMSGVRLPMAPSGGEVPVVYLLATPGIRSATGAGAAMQTAGSGIVPSAVSRASFTVVSRAAVGATTAANGDVRPLLRFMQISKRPPGNVIPGPVGPLTGLHLVGPRPGSAGRMTPVFGPVVGSAIVRPPTLSSATPVVGGPSGTVVSGGGLAIVPFSGPQSVVNRVVNPAAANGSATGIVRLATLQPQQLVATTGGFAAAALSPSSAAAAAMFLSRLASAGNATIELQQPRPGTTSVNGQRTPPPSLPLLQSSLNVPASAIVASSSSPTGRSRPSRSHQQGASMTSSTTVVGSATMSSRSATGQASTTTPTAGDPSASTTTPAAGGNSVSRQTVQEKNAYEYERVMDILRYYRELVVERKLPGACLPCKRRKSKPLVSVGSGSAAAGHHDEESSPLPIPPPPPPPITNSARVPAAAMTTACSVVGGIVVSASAAIRVPYVNTAAAGCANGLRHVGMVSMPLNVRQLTAAAVFPSRFVVPAPSQLTSSASMLPAPASGGAVPRLVFYTPTSSSTSLNASQICQTALTKVSTCTSGTGENAGDKARQPDAASTAANDSSCSQPAADSSPAKQQDPELLVAMEPHEKSDLSKFLSSTSLSSSPSSSLSAFDTLDSRPRSVDSAMRFANRSEKHSSSQLAASDFCFDDPLPSVRRRSHSLSDVAGFCERDIFIARKPQADGFAQGGPDHVTVSTTVADGNGDVESMSSSSLFDRSSADELCRRQYFNGLLVSDDGGGSHINDIKAAASGDERLEDTALAEIAVSDSCPLSSSSVITWPSSAHQADGERESGVGGVDCDSADDALAAVRMARKRHLVDDDVGSAAGDVEADENDVATWPEVENTVSLDGGECVVSQQRPPELLAELQEAYPETETAAAVMASVRQPVAVKEPGLTLTTVTFVTKWTTSRLAVSGPYQSWT